MESIDLAQCGMIYSKAFPMEHWGIDWTAENATEYLQDFFEQKRFVGYVYEENSEVLSSLSLPLLSSVISLSCPYDSILCS